MAVLHVFWVVNVALLEHQHVESVAALAYVVLITVLVVGSLTYLSARYGYARRFSRHRPASDSEIDAFGLTVVPSVTILVPSYKEDSALVWKTLFSAALQDYPRRAVVLLVDDPPVAATHEDARALDEMRELADAVERRVGAVHARVRSAAAAFEQRADAARLRLSVEARELAGLYREVAVWFAEEACAHRVVDHSDAVFVEVTLLGESRRYQRQAADLLRDAKSEAIDEYSLRCAYRRLASRFEVTVRTFERKRYTNLSHEPNKAMNLNTYIALMGGRFRERADGARRVLENATPGEQVLEFDDSD